jgi:hypothetical protein
MSLNGARRSAGPSSRLDEVPTSPQSMRSSRSADREGFDSGHCAASNRSADLSPEVGEQVKSAKRGQWTLRNSFPNSSQLYFTW